MTRSTRDLLRQTLAASYSKLRQRLARKLGSDAAAQEVLHETWLRLGQGGELGPVANREGYVYRVAINTAHSIKLADDRAPRALDIGEAREVPDEAPDADRILDAEDQVRRVNAAIADLSERQRDAFLHCVVHGGRIEAMAERYGVTVRTIQADLRAAIIHCARRLGRKDILADRTFRVSRE